MKNFLNKIPGSFRRQVNVALLCRRYPLSKRFIIARDYYRLCREKGLTAEEYYDFEFDRQTDEFRESFLGLNEQRFYLDYLNPKKFYILARNKYLAHRTLEHAGIRKSQLYCYYDPEGSYPGSDDMAGDLASLHAILLAKGVRSCVIKGTESSHGDNVFVVESINYTDDDAELKLFDGQVKRLSEVIGAKPLVFEEVIRQTEQLSALNASSVNTVRFMTALYPDGSARVIGCFIKIGLAGKCIDNAGAGGNVDACVDVQTGQVKYAVRFDGWRKVHEIEKHPDSGMQINGMVINNWESIREEVVGFQKAFPFIKAAGWDIAITDEGPVVVEVNDFWDRTGQFFIRRGWRNEIRDCYQAWKETGARYVFGRKLNDLSLHQLNSIVEK